jgi:YD repeat-containing protein
MKHVVMVIALMSIAGLSGWAFGQDPNYVKTNVYTNDVTDDSVQTTTTYSDGLGRKIQTRLELGDNKARIAGTLYDEAGNPTVTTLPFKISTTSYPGFFDGNIVTAAQADLNDDYPYNEVQYKPDPLANVDRAGAPGLDFSLDGYNFSKTWNFSTALGRGDVFIDDNGFILETALLDPMTRLDLIDGQKICTGTPTHFLTVTKGPNGDYTQQLKDLFGNTISTCSMKNIMANYEYDLLGRVIKEIPPDATAARAVDNNRATKYEYDKQGRLTSKTTPDGGLVKFVYDDKNRLVASQNAKQRATDAALAFTVYLYDDLGRNYAIGDNLSLNTFSDAGAVDWAIGILAVRVRRIYDDPGQLQNSDVLGSVYTPQYFSSNYASLTNTTGRLVAEIGYLTDYAGVPGSDVFFRRVTVDIYSYDDEGNVISKIKRVPGMSGFWLFSYSYDRQGNLKTYQFTKDERGGGAPGFQQNPIVFDRDRQGRVQTVFSGSNPFILNEFDDYGRLVTKHFGTDVTAEATTADKVNYAYDIRNWPLSIASSNQIFSEWLAYADNHLLNGQTVLGMTPQYNGNIAAAQYAYNQADVNPPITGIVNYNYDEVNRLTDVVNVSNPTQFQNEEITYKADGRIDTKVKSSGAIPTVDIPTYQYYENKNQLNKIDHKKDQDNNYIYDPNGNMVLDFSKKMLVEYDWRDMPVKYKFFDQIPTSILTGDVSSLWHDLEGSITSPLVPGHGKVVSEVDMNYDASGNRVTKREYKLQ